jgi:hypothetical protein
VPAEHEEELNAVKLVFEASGIVGYLCYQAVVALVSRKLKQFPQVGGALGETTPLVYLGLEHGEVTHDRLRVPGVFPEAGLLRLFCEARYFRFFSG